MIIPYNSETWDKCRYIQTPTVEAGCFDTMPGTVDAHGNVNQKGCNFMNRNGSTKRLAG